MSDVYGAGTEPAFCIPVTPFNFLLGSAIGFKIFQYKEFIIAVQQRFPQLSEHGIFFQYFQRPADICVTVINIPGGIAAFLIIPLHFVRTETENHAVLVPDFLMDLHVGS